MPKRHYLELTLKGEIVEGHPEQSFFARKSKTSLQDLLNALSQAGKEPKISALLLGIKDLSAGWAGLESLRRSLLEFRRKGKTIYCYLEAAGNAEYYVASACDRIFITPSASLHLVGLSAEAFFFRDVLDLVGVEPQMLAVGEYKSAAEMFLRNGMSAPAREQMESLLDDCYEAFCGAIAEGRGISREDVSRKIDSGPYTAQEAVRIGLIDQTGYEDEVSGKLEEKFGGITSVPAARYFRGEGFWRRLLTFRRPRIAIVEISGMIDVGESRRDRTGRHVAGSDTVGAFLDHARKSRRTVAAVLRINSPGGSGTGSDLLWRKIGLLASTKPVVASFGDVAASGGYYIATAANKITAESTSITGSIGVIGGKFIARRLMDRLSVHRESLRRGAHAEYASLFEPFSAEEELRLKCQLEEFYREDFVKKVAEGRKMDTADVDRLGRGRVWSGIRAKEERLVDLIGGPLEAMAEARKLAGIREKRKIREVEYHRRRRLLDMIMPDLTAQTSLASAPNPILHALGFIERFRKQAVWLLLPFDIRIK